MTEDQRGVAVGVLILIGSFANGSWLAGTDSPYREQGDSIGNGESFINGDQSLADRLISQSAERDVFRCYVTENAAILA